MVRLLAFAGLVLFGATLHRAAVADEVKGAKSAPADPTVVLLAKLRQPLALPPGEVPLAEFAAAVEKATGVGVVVSEAAFRSDSGTEEPDPLPVRPTRFKGATAAAVLKHTLAKQGATYLVRRDHVEIVPLAAARREARQPTASDANGDPIEPFPLVSAVVRERPLNEALADLAADHDLTVVVSPQAGDQKMAFVSARLLNVPADRAVELLALQADLRVVRRGAAFLVTSKDHGEGLFNERADREQRKIELQNLRNAPFGRPGGPGVPLAFCGVGGALGAVGFGGPGGAHPAQPPAPPAGAAGFGGVGFGGAGFGGAGIGGSGPGGVGFGGPGGAQPAQPPAPPAGGR